MKRPKDFPPLPPGAKVTAIDLGALGVPAKARGRARTTPSPDGMNASERAYSQHLERLRLLGQIDRWDFEAEKFRLGPVGAGAWFRPDFRVVMPDGLVEFHDVKGHMEDDALVKIKVFVRLHPYPLVVVTRRKGGGWDLQRWEG
jgi:hypothetical protein